MDEWEKIRKTVQSFQKGLEEPNASVGPDDTSDAGYWKRKYEEEKRAVEERISRIDRDDRLRAEKQRFAEEQVKLLTAQIQALEQRISWEKLLAEERYKLRNIEVDYEKKIAHYESRIALHEEEMAALRVRMRQAQELFEEEKTMRQRAEAEKKLLDQEYRTLLLQPRAVSPAAEGFGSVREIENENRRLEKKIRELESKQPEGGKDPATEKELAALREELAGVQALHDQREKDQLFSVEDMARGFAHKVRNYLGIMSGTLQLSLTNEKMNEELKTQIVTVDDAAQEMLKVIEEYLALTKIPQLEMLPVEVGALVNGAVELAEPAAKNLGVTIQKEVPTGLPPLPCDAASLKDAIKNVLDNAAEASANGGGVTIRARLDEPSRKIHIDVIDKGKGIGENHFKKVYQPYFTNKKDRRGMGLSTAKRAIELHMGTLSFTSVKGQGSTFTISLPLGKKS